MHLFEPWVALVGPLYVLVISVPLIIFDVKQRRLPNRLVLPGLPIAMLVQTIACVITQNFAPLGVGLLWMLGGFGFGLLFNRLGALGMGDAKLIALLCLNLGWFDPVWPLISLVAAFFVATVLVLLGFVFRRQSLSSSIPLGPYLLGGFALVLTQLA